MKKTTKIELKFVDNDNHIEFDLSKNTVFYGLNGHGKTRILKTIQLLSELGKTKNFKGTLEIVKTLNLDYLRIDEIDHDGLFRSSKEIANKEKERLKEKIMEHSDYLNYLFELLTFLGDSLNDSSDYIPPSLLNTFNSHIRFNTREYETLTELFIKNPIELRNWLQQTQHIANQINNTEFYLLENGDHGTIKQIDRLTMILLEEIFYINFYKKNSDSILFSNLEKQREDVINDLGAINVHYISTENIDLDNIIQKIKKEVNTSKDLLFSSFFNQLKNDKPSFNPNIALNLLTSLHSKTKTLNEVLKKYCPIKLNIDELANLTFTKNNETIDFYKLSSGEQRIIYIFFNIIFFDADIYLIDEPELSLSIDYQNKIVTDLITLANDKTLMVATHAPFIFNDFKILENTNIKEV